MGTPRFPSRLAGRCVRTDVHLLIQDGGRRHGAQAWERVVAFAPQLTGYLRALAFRRGKGGVEFPLAGATLRNGFLEKTFRQGRREKHAYRLRSPD